MDGDKESGVKKFNLILKEKKEEEVERPTIKKQSNLLWHSNQIDTCPISICHLHNGPSAQNLKKS